MKVSYFAFMAAAMWACCGCSSEKSGDKPVADAKIGIRTSILDRSEMRTPSLDSNGSGSFADGDHFSLLVSDGADGLLDFDYETGATQLYWKDVTFASSPEKVHFAACYPKRDLSGAQFAFDLETEADKDLLLARTADVPAGTTAPVDLTFRHAMHRLVVTFTDDSDVDTESVQTVCTARSACTVDLLDGTLKTDEDRKASFSARGKSVFFLLVPPEDFGCGVRTPVRRPDLPGFAERPCRLARRTAWRHAATCRTDAQGRARRDRQDNDRRVGRPGYGRG